MTNHPYLDQLILDCQQAKNTIPIETIIFNQHIFPKNTYAVYMIREINPDPIKTFESFKDFKMNFKNKKCPHPNAPSDILYIGSSRTNLNKRLEEHTTKGNDATFALRLYDWFEGNYEIEIHLYNNISAAVLQLIEDNLAFTLQPAFGKRGSNNK